MNDFLFYNTVIYGPDEMMHVTFIIRGSESIIKQLNSLQLPGEVQAFIHIYFQTWGERSDHIIEFLQFDQDDLRKQSLTLWYSKFESPKLMMSHAA